VLAILDALKDKLPVGIGAIKQGLLEVEWPARFQVMPGRPTVILDVGHNPHAATVLRGALDQMGFYAKTHAVLGMMADKDVAGVVALLADRIDVWHLAAPQLPRAMPVDALAKIVAGIAPNTRIECYGHVANAYAGACEAAGETDRILAFGSFFTVAEVLAARGSGL
jgi:dihydrofolate synthase / folylpolyglutamate synthase